MSSGRNRPRKRGADRWAPLSLPDAVDRVIAAHDDPSVTREEWNGMVATLAHRLVESSYVASQAAAQRIVDHLASCPDTPPGWLLPLPMEVKERVWNELMMTEGL